MNLESRNNFKQQFKSRCFEFSLQVLQITDSLRSKRDNWPLLDQLIRSGTSIGANVVEGGNSTSKREFINYFQIALKSSSETLYWLAILEKINLDKEDNIRILIGECSQLKRIISTIILNTKQNSKL